MAAYMRALPQPHDGRRGVGCLDKVLQTRKHTRAHIPATHVLLRAMMMCRRKLGIVRRSLCILILQNEQHPLAKA